MNIDIKRFDKNLPLPAYTPGAACFDYFCAEAVEIAPGQIKAVKLNVAIRIPPGYAILIFSRSSTPLRKGLMLANGVAVIDPKYSGDNDEHLAFLTNITDHVVTTEIGDRLVQGMLMEAAPVEWQEVDSLNDAGYGGYQHLEHLK